MGAHAATGVPCRKTNTPVSGVTQNAFPLSWSVTVKVRLGWVSLGVTHAARPFWVVPPAAPAEPLDPAAGWPQLATKRAAPIAVAAVMSAVPRIDASHVR